MGEDHLLRPAMPDTLDHGGMVACVREDNASRQPTGQRAQCCPVRHVAGIEQQGRFGAVQICQFLFQQDMVVVGAGDVAGAPCPRAAAIQRLVHRCKDRWMLAHAKVVIGTPDSDLGPSPLAHMGGMGKAARSSLQVSKNPVIPLAAEAVELLPEEKFVVHSCFSPL